MEGSIQDLDAKVDRNHEQVVDMLSHLTANLMRMTPAMRAGLTRKWYDMEWLTDLVEKAQPKPRRPRGYRKRGE